MGKNVVESMGFQTISAATLVAPTALTVPEYAEYCLVQCESGNVRWRDDGINPTSTVGMKLNDGSELKFDATMNVVRFIAVSGSPVLMITYYG